MSLGFAGWRLGVGIWDLIVKSSGISPSPSHSRHPFKARRGVHSMACPRCECSSLEIKKTQFPQGDHRALQWYLGYEHSGSRVGRSVFSQFKKAASEIDRPPFFDIEKTHESGRSPFSSNQENARKRSFGFLENEACTSKCPSLSQVLSTFASRHMYPTGVPRP